MNLRQRYNLYRNQQALNPSRQFKAALWRTLSVRLQQPAWYQTVWVRFSTVTLSSVLVVATASTSVYAYTSPTVSVGSPLYPLKQGLEKIEETTKVTPAQKAQFLLKTIQRREAEKKTLEIANQDVEATENQIQVAAQKLQQVAAVMPTSTASTNLHREVSERLEKQQKHWVARQEKILEHERAAEDLMKVEMNEANVDEADDVMVENTTTDMLPMLQSDDAGDSIDTAAVKTSHPESEEEYDRKPAGNRMDRGDQEHEDR